jgi:hypothetical protein
VKIWRSSSKIIAPIVSHPSSHSPPSSHHQRSSPLKVTSPLHHTVQQHRRSTTPFSNIAAQGNILIFFFLCVLLLSLCVHPFLRLNLFYVTILLIIILFISDLRFENIQSLITRFAGLVLRGVVPLLWCCCGFSGFFVVLCPATVLNLPDL